MPLDVGFNEERYVKLLTNLIGETKFLQDNPPRFIPEEDRHAKSSVYISALHNSLITQGYQTFTRGTEAVYEREWRSAESSPRDIRGRKRKPDNRI